MHRYRYPLELVYCVQDLVFAEGVEAMLRFALALMKRNEHHLLTLEFEQLLEYLKSGLYEVYRVRPAPLPSATLVRIVGTDTRTGGSARVI